MAGSNNMATYEVIMPSDYLHILNCICIYKVKKTYKCYNRGDYWRSPATRLTADMYSQVLDNFWNKPTYKRPYYYIHNVNKYPYISTNPVRDYEYNTHITVGNKVKKFFDTYTQVIGFEKDNNKITVLKSTTGNSGNEAKRYEIKSNDICVETAPNIQAITDNNTINWQIVKTSLDQSNSKQCGQTLSNDDDVVVKAIQKLGVSSGYKNDFIQTNEDSVESDETTFSLKIGTDVNDIDKNLPNYHPNIDETTDETTYGTDAHGKDIVQGSGMPTSILTNSGEISNVERGQGIRYGNVSQVRLEIRYGTDNQVFELEKVYVDYIKAPQNIRLTQQEIDLTEDTSQMLEYPDYVCQEIINELIHLIMENISDQRLQTHPVVTQSIANPAQQQAPAQEA